MQPDTGTAVTTLGVACIQGAIGPDKTGYQLWQEVARVQLTLHLKTLEGGGAVIERIQSGKVVAPTDGVYRVHIHAGNLSGFSTELHEVKKGEAIPIGTETTDG